MAIKKVDDLSGSELAVQFELALKTAKETGALYDLTVHVVKYVLGNEVEVSD